MLNRKDTTTAIKGLRSIARKNTDSDTDVDALLAENMGVDKSVIERIALGDATQGDFILAGAALTRLAAEMESDDVAEKSSDTPRSNRDAIGRSRTKPHGGSPRDIRARESARADDSSSERDGFGRSRRKVYS